MAKTRWPEQFLPPPPVFRRHRKSRTIRRVRASRWNKLGAVPPPNPPQGMHVRPTTAPRWEGATCDTDIDDCADSPCENAGTCADAGTDAFTCTCASGWTGPRCTLDIDDCDPSPCQNGATCTDTGTNSYLCTCAPGCVRPWVFVCPCV